MESSIPEALKNTIALIRSQLPEFDSISKEARASGGYLVLQQQIIALLNQEGLPPWSSFYEDAKRLKSISFATLIGPDEVRKLDDRMEGMNHKEKDRIRESFKAQILKSDTIDLEFDSYKIPTDKEFDSWLEAALAGENSENAVRFYLLLYSMVTQGFEYLAVMTFARTMTALVRLAIQGNDKAFFDAVRVDKTVLFGIPYFQKRLIRAQFEGDLQFFQKLSTAIRGTSLGSKISHRRLMFVFALLDDEGYLDLPLEQLLDICNEVGVTEISDIESLRKRRKYYREQTGRQIKF